MSCSLAANSKLQIRRLVRQLETNHVGLHIDQIDLVLRVTITGSDVIEMSFVRAVLLNFQSLTDIDHGDTRVFQLEKHGDLRQLFGEQRMTGRFRCTLCTYRMDAGEHAFEDVRRVSGRGGEEHAETGSDGEDHVTGDARTEQALFGTFRR